MKFKFFYNLISLKKKKKKKKKNFFPMLDKDYRPERTVRPMRSNQPRTRPRSHDQKVHAGDLDMAACGWLDGAS